LVRTMSQDPAERDALLQAGLALKLTMAMISVVLSVAFVGIASNHQTPPGLMLVAALNLPTALGGAYRAWQRSRLEIGELFARAGRRRPARRCLARDRSVHAAPRSAHDQRLSTDGGPPRTRIAAALRDRGALDALPRRGNRSARRAVRRGRRPHHAPPVRACL